MTRDFFDPTPDDQNVVLAEADTIRRAERLIDGCEQCSDEADEAEIPFDSILDRITGSDPSVTDYLMQQPAKCPLYKREIFEKTLVELRSE